MLIHRLVSPAALDHPADDQPGWSNADQTAWSDAGQMGRSNTGHPPAFGRGGEHDSNAPLHADSNTPLHAKPSTIDHGQTMGHCPSSSGSCGPVASSGWSNHRDGQTIDHSSGRSNHGQPPPLLPTPPAGDPLEWSNAGWPNAGPPAGGGSGGGGGGGGGGGARCRHGAFPAVVGAGQVW